MSTVCGFADRIEARAAVPEKWCRETPFTKLRTQGAVCGFTLIELVITILVIGILAAVVAPRFFDVRIFQDRAFYDQAIASVRYAQKLAIATRCPVRVQFTTTGLALYRPATTGACTTGPYDTAVTDPSGAAATFTRTAPSGLTLTAANFSFTADGGTAADVTISVGDRTFQVHATTGFVQEL